MTLGKHPVISDPIHVPCEAPVRWSRGNLSEFLPGVVTPFTWDFWLSNQSASQRLYYRLGMARRDELSVPEAPELRTTSIFHGWPVANVDALRNMVDRAPGNAGDSFERQLLGEADLPAQTDPPPIRKRPLNIALKSGLWFQTFPREIRDQVARTDAWWRATIAAAQTASLARCQTLLDSAYERNDDVSVHAGFGLFGGQMLFGQLEAALPQAHKHLILTLVSGHGDLQEMKLVDTMWRIARGEGDLAQFLADYGYYGVSVGECMNPSWREDPTQVEDTIAAYKADPGAPSPADRTRQRDARVAESLATLDRVLKPVVRKRVHNLIAQLERFTLWREEGKSCALKAIDGARAAVRRMGHLLTEQGALESADDAFFFTREELRRAPFDGMRETAIWRRARRAFYEKLDLPDAFIGPPIVRSKRAERHITQEPLDANEEIDGIGVSPGIVEGTARVIADPRSARVFNTSDILVCQVTDPSWAPLFTRAGGIVTDIGGILSHGAVIARELNVPCVVNTRGGTRRIPDGARIRIDGATGAVRILSLPREELAHAV